jgi:tRNA-modifying protein YgfZ
MKTSAIHEIHEREALSFTDASGWTLPRAYRGAEPEFLSLMSGAGLGDTSFTGRLEVRGKDALDLLHRISTNNLLTLGPGQIVGTLLTTDKGRIVDLVFVAPLEEGLLLITSPGAEEKILRWIEKYTILEDVRARSVTAETCMMSLLGGRAISVAASVVAVNVVPNTCQRLALPFGEARLLALSASRWQLVHFIVRADQAAAAWEWLSERARAKGIDRIGTEAYELFRLACGMPAPGREISDAFNPYDVGLLEFVSFSKGCYIGQEVIARIDTYQKARRGLIGFTTGTPPPVSIEGAVITKNGMEAGTVTSWSRTPVRSIYCGLAVVRTADIEPGAELVLEAGGEKVKGRAEGLPLNLA